MSDEYDLSEYFTPEEIASFEKPKDVTTSRILPDRRIEVTCGTCGRVGILRVEETTTIRAADDLNDLEHRYIECRGCRRIDKVTADGFEKHREGRR